MKIAEVQSHHVPSKKGKLFQTFLRLNLSEGSDTTLQAAAQLEL